MRRALLGAKWHLLKRVIARSEATKQSFWPGISHQEIAASLALLAKTGTLPPSSPYLIDSEQISVAYCHNLYHWQYVTEVKLWK
jgi:hypothetical protein